MSLRIFSQGSQVAGPPTPSRGYCSNLTSSQIIDGAISCTMTVWSERQTSVKRQRKYDFGPGAMDSELESTRIYSAPIFVYTLS